MRRQPGMPQTIFRASAACDRGRVLPAMLRAHLARLLGASLGGISVRICSEAEAIGALAVARGNQLILSPRVLALRRAARLGVLGHELVHVLQQRQGATRGFAIAEPPVLESEAIRAGRRIAAGRRVVLRSHTRHRPHAACQRIKLMLRGTKDGDLDAPALLHLMDTALCSRIGSAPACAKVLGTVTVTQGGHWLNLLGKLAFAGAIVPNNRKVNTILPVSLKIGADGTAMPIYEQAGTKGVTERLDFPAGAVRWATGKTGAVVPAKLDLNYIQIAAGFTRLNNGGAADEEIAEKMLLKMKGLPAAVSYGADGDAFIEAVVALMFGVEGSRFPSAFLTSLLLLDLIRTRKCYGRAATKRFKLAAAFDSQKNFDFDCLYGGKFPCAVHEPGRGNAANRRMLGQLGGQLSAIATTSSSHFNRGEGAQMMLDLNHRFIVPRREVTLLVHWLEARFGEKFLPQIGRLDVLKAIAGRIDSACAADAALPGLMFFPREDSGMHQDDIPGYRNPIAMGSTVYWMFHNGTEGRWYHTTPQCKKLGGRTPGLQARLDSSYRPQDRTKEVADGKGGTRTLSIVPATTMRTLKVVRNLRDPETEVRLAEALKYKCPHCVS